MNIIEDIQQEMLSDFENTSKQSAYLRRVYEGADERGKAALDDALICICGFSLTTLIERDDERYNGDGEEDEE